MLRFHTSLCWIFGRSMDSQTLLFQNRFSGSLRACWAYLFQQHPFDWHCETDFWLGWCAIRCDDTACWMGYHCINQIPQVPPLSLVPHIHKMYKRLTIYAVIWRCLDGLFWRWRCRCPKTVSERFGFFLSKNSDHVDITDWFWSAPKLRKTFDWIINLFGLYVYFPIRADETLKLRNGGISSRQISRRFSIKSFADGIWPTVSHLVASQVLQ